MARWQPQDCRADGSGITLRSFATTGLVRSPFRGDYAFVPSSIAYADVLADQPNQNYLASPVVYTVNFVSTGVYDGWVLESSETSNKGGTINAAGKIFPAWLLLAADRQQGYFVFRYIRYT